MRVDIKPLSVNKAWKGKRYKTPIYKQYERDVIRLLRYMKIPEGYLEINLVFGFSSKSSDFDNPVKPFVDCLQKKYGFNDNKIKRATIDIEMVSKGNEFIAFTLKGMEK